MLPAAFCAGMTLPLITAYLYRHGSGERAIEHLNDVPELTSLLTEADGLRIVAARMMHLTRAQADEIVAGLDRAGP